MTKLKSAVLLLTSTFTAACISDEDTLEDPVEDPDSTGSTEQALVGAPPTYWSGNPILIPVCWSNPNNTPTVGSFLSDANVVPESTLRGWAREVVEGQWSRYARVNFTQWDTCTTGEPGIHINIRSTGGSSSGFGTQTNGVEFGMNLNLYLAGERPECHATTATLKRCIQQIALHEFGHALGFAHEENRPGYVQTDPAPDCAPQGSVSTDKLYGAYDLASVMSYCGQAGAAFATLKDTLSPGNIASVQAVYGRRLPGQVVGTRGADMMATNISPNPTFLWDADEAPGQLWTYNWARQAFEVQTGGRSGCLDAWPLAQHGSPLVSEFCFYDSFQKFRFDDVSVRGFGGLCLEHPGTYANGTALRVGNCSDGGQQRWAIDPSKRVRLIGTQKCATWSSQIGASLVLWDCGAADVASRQSFDFRADGTLAFDANRCVDVLGPTDTEFASGIGLPRAGSRVYTYYCGFDHQHTQRWNLSGRITHGSGLCVDHQSSNTNGSRVELRTCNNSESQRWDYYWR